MTNPSAGPARLTAARELLTATPTLEAAAAGQKRCGTCGSPVLHARERQHQVWHEAIAVMAGLVFGPGQ